MGSGTPRDDVGLWGMWAQWPP